MSDHSTDTPAEDTDGPASGPRKFAIPALTGVFVEPWSGKKLIGLMRFFGPAAIVASLSIGAGETIVVVRTGAWAEYDLLWLVLLACIVKGLFITYLLGRYTAVSGEQIGHRLVRVPGPRGWLLITIVVLELLVAPFAWVPIAKPCGSLGEFFFSGYLPVAWSEQFTVNLFTTLFILAALTLSLGVSFARLEKQQLFICAVLVTGTIIGTLMVKPDWVKALMGMVPHAPPPTPDWAPAAAKENIGLNLATAFAYVGGSVMGYIVYAEWVDIHKWGMGAHAKLAELRQHASTRDRIDYLPDDPEAVRRLRTLVSPLRWDVSMGALVLFIVTAAFMMSGAAVLFKRETAFEGWDLLTNQATVWDEIHPKLIYVYYVTIILALWGTLQALPEVYARVTQEFFTAIWPDRKWNRKKMMLIINIWIFTLSTVLIWSNVPFDILTSIAGFILANVGVAVMAVGVIWLNSKLPKAYRTSPFMLAGAVVSTVILMIAAGLSGYGLLLKVMG